MDNETYTAVVRDPDNTEVDGHDIYWYEHMTQEMEDMLAEAGWKRSPRTDLGAAGVWSHNPAFPNRTITVHVWRRCWNMFCVNDEHVDADDPHLHVDNTGHQFYAEGKRFAIQRDYLD